MGKIGNKVMEVQEALAEIPRVPYDVIAKQCGVSNKFVEDVEYQNEDDEYYDEGEK